MGTAINIADLPEDVQDLVVEHLKLQNSSSAQQGKFNKTDFIQISGIFSPQQK